MNKHQLITPTRIANPFISKYTFMWFKFSTICPSLKNIFSYCVRLQGVKFFYSEWDEVIFVFYWKLDALQLIANWFIEADTCSNWILLETLCPNIGSPFQIAARNIFSHFGKVLFMECFWPRMTLLDWNGKLCNFTKRHFAVFECVTFCLVLNQKISERT
jgi:hypothetical protein